LAAIFVIPSPSINKAIAGDHLPIQEGTLVVRDVQFDLSGHPPRTSWADVERQEETEGQPWSGPRKYWDVIGDREINDHSPFAAGKVFVLHVFAEDWYDSWEDDSLNPLEVDRENIKQVVKSACDWIVSKAPDGVNLQFSNHGSPTFTTYWVNVEVDFWIPQDEGNSTWTYQTVSEIGFSDTDDSGTNIDEMLDACLEEYPEYDWAIALFHVHKQGTSAARKSHSRAVLYSHGFDGLPSQNCVAAHEILHLFGADDEYSEACDDDDCDTPVSHDWNEWSYFNGNCEDCSDEYPTAIMRWYTDLIDLPVICPYTKGHIGWGDGDQDGKYDFEEAAPYSWITSPERTQPTIMSSLTVRGFAWSPYSDINRVDFQVNDEVDGNAWITVDSPDDGAWDEVRESVSFSADLEEGENKVWIRAWNSSAGAQNSILDSYEIIRDTTGPPGPVVHATPNDNEDEWWNVQDIQIRWDEPDDPSGVLAYYVGVNTSPDTPDPPDYLTIDSTYDFTTSGSNEYYVHVAAVDGVGNVGQTTHYRLRVDRTPPSAPSLQSSTHEASVWSNDTDVTFTWSATDDHSGINGYKWELDLDPDTEVTSFTANSYTQAVLDQSDLYAGIQYFHVAAVDIAGNFGPTSHFPLYIWTGVPPIPVPTHTDPPVGSVWYRTSDVTFGWQVPSCPSGIEGYAVSLTPGQSGQPPDTDALDTCPPSFSYSGLESGYHTFGVRARDFAGNWGAAGYVTIGLDITRPEGVADLVSPSHSGWGPSANPFVTIEFTAATDAHSGLANHAVVWDQVYNTVPTNDNAMDLDPGTTFTSPSLTTGLWYAHVGAVDRKNNWTHWQDVAHLGPIEIDVTPPSAPTSLAASSRCDAVDLTWSSPPEDDIDYYVLYRSTDEDLLGEAVAPNVPGTGYSDITVLNGDIYYYRVTAVDDAGLESEPTYLVVGRPEYVSPGNLTTFSNLAALEVASNGGVRSDGAGGYTMHGSVTISFPDILNIGPGETLHSVDRSGTRMLIIQGTLRAIGTTANPIRIYADWPRAGAWGGILMDHPGSNSLLSCVRIFQGVNNVVWLGSNPSISSCEIAFATSAGVTISVEPGKSCNVVENTIHHCEGQGLSVFAHGQSSTNIAENLITDNGSGIDWNTECPGTPPIVMDIHHNEVQDNEGDGIVCGFGGANTFIRNNVVHNNDRGIVFNSEGWMQTKPLIQFNEITANATAGIYLSQQAQPDIFDNNITANPNYAVYCDASGPALRDNSIQGSTVGVLVDQNSWIDLGTLYSPGRNRLDQHSGFYVENLTGSTVQARGNYWGAAQANPMAVNFGPVVFTPLWNPTNGPPSITVTQPAAGGLQTSTSATIKWSDFDPNPADTLLISFFCDQDSMGQDGVGIAGGSGIDGWDPADSLTWDVRQVPAGSYYVYGVISDGTRTASSYSPGTVTVVHPEIAVATDTLRAFLSRGDTTTVPLDLRNVGTAVLAGGLTEDDGSGQPIPWLSLSPPTFNIQTGDTATVGVTFDATGLGDNIYRARFHVSSNDPSDSLLTVPVALKVGHSEIELSDDTISFGTVSVGDTLRTTVTLHNSGSDTLRIASLTGPSPPFAAEILDAPNAAPGDTIRIGVAAQPTARGYFTDQVIINSNDSFQPQRPVQLSVTATGPAVALPDTVHDFGGVALGDTASWAFGVTNTGEIPVSVSGIASSTDVFLIPAAGGFQVAAGDTVEVLVHFAPRTPGQTAGTLTVVHNDPAGPDTIDLTGWGQAGNAAFGDTLLAFGAVSLGDTVTAIAWLLNHGDAGFEVTAAQTDGCFELLTSGAPWTVAAGDSMALNLRFAPTLGGTITGHLTATTTDAEGSSPLLALRGTGMFPGFGWDLEVLDFGPVVTGIPADTTVVLRNPGEGVVTIDGGLPEDSDFQVISPSFPTTIAGQDSVVVQLRFQPEAATAYADTLRVTPSWSLLDTLELALTGRGAAAYPTLSTLSHAFGPTFVGDQAGWWLTVFNQGEAPAVVEVNSPGAPFALADSSVLTVPAEGQGVITVLFTPDQVGTWTDSLVVWWNDPPETLGTVTLTGAGVTADLVPSPISIVSDVFEEETGQEVLKVRNSGSGYLYFTLLEDGEVGRPGKAASKSGLAGHKEGRAKDSAPRSGDHRLMNRLGKSVGGAACVIEAGSLPGGKEGPLARFTGKAGVALTARKEGTRTTDIPWASISVPHEFVYPDSSADAFIDLDSSGLLPAVYQGKLLLLTSDAAADTTPIDLFMRVPRMRYATHDTGRIRLTVTDEGAIGFFDAGQFEAYGAGLQWPPGGPSHLFHGSLWVADGPNRLSDASYDYDFAVVPGQELAVTPGDPQTSRCAFTDALAANPLGVQVEQTTYALGGDPDADYVMFDFILSTTIPREGVFVGLYLDVDIGSIFQNTGGYLADSRLGQMFAADASDSTRIGIVAMPGQAPAAFRLIHNPTYVWPQDDFEDATAWGFLNSGVFDDGVPSPDDYSMLMAVGPVAISPSQPVRVGFAVVAGGSEATLQAAAVAAGAAYMEHVTDVETPVPRRFALGAPFPNPFNPTLNLPVEAPVGGGSVRLGIYDLAGRRVRTIWHGHIQEGRSVLTWDGRDERSRTVASGVYFVRFLSPTTSKVRKVVLLR